MYVHKEGHVHRAGHAHEVDMIFTTQWAPKAYGGSELGNFELEAFCQKWLMNV
jgi:hypothetical protein